MVIVEILNGVNQEVFSLSRCRRNVLLLPETNNISNLTNLLLTTLIVSYVTAFTLLKC